MKIKKFEGATEEKAVEKAKNELGGDVLIISTKLVKPKGFFSFLKKGYWEVSAAAENEKTEPEKAERAERVNNVDSYKLAASEALLKQSHDRITELEQQLKLAQSKADDEKYENKAAELFYNTLTGQGVSHNLTKEILKDIENIENDINLMVKIVYNNIVGVLKTGKLDFDKKTVLFMGPTGVGKTTTIAKLSSSMILNDEKKIGFITSDTYRIAAVEQLKTYAEILDSEVKVVYTPQELEQEVKMMKVINDMVFIDTAGRSHKNKENIDELKEFINASGDCEKLLVLSMTTKYDDMIDIINAYSQFADFKLAFTKLDETVCIGTMLDVCKNTGKEIVYVSSGQNVPDDIEPMSAEKIAKTLLGSIK